MNHLFDLHFHDVTPIHGMEFRDFHLRDHHLKISEPHSASAPKCLHTSPVYSLPYIKNPPHCLLFILTTVLIAFAFGCSPAKTPETIRPRVVKLCTVGSPELSSENTFFGVTQAARRASLSFQVGGRIELLPTEMGDHVAEGQLLAQLDPIPFELRVKQAEADLVSAKASLHERQQVFDSEKRLLPQAATTQIEYDQAEASLALAKSRLEIAEATLRLAKRDLANTKLIAPMSGRIAQRNVQNFTEIVPGTSIFELDGDGELEISVAVPENFKITQDTPVKVRLKNDDLGQISGVVSKIGSRSDIANTIPLIVRLKNYPPGLRTGTAAEVVFPPQDQSLSVVLPVVAVIPGDTPNNGYVYIFDNGQAKKRQVSLGKPVGEGLSILSGLNQGEQIIVAGATFLTEGQAVRPFQPTGNGSNGNLSK